MIFERCIDVRTTIPLVHLAPHTHNFFSLLKKLYNWSYVEFCADYEKLCLTFVALLVFKLHAKVCWKTWSKLSQNWWQKFGNFWIRFFFNSIKCTNLVPNYVAEKKVVNNISKGQFNLLRTFLDIAPQRVKTWSLSWTLWPFWESHKCEFLTFISTKTAKTTLRKG